MRVRVDLSLIYGPTAVFHSSPLNPYRVSTLINIEVLVSATAKTANDLRYQLYVTFSRARESTRGGELMLLGSLQFYHNELCCVRPPHRLRAVLPGIACVRHCSCIGTLPRCVASMTGDASALIDQRFTSLPLCLCVSLPHLTTKHAHLKGLEYPAIRANLLVRLAVRLLGGDPPRV